MFSYGYHFCSNNLKNCEPTILNPDLTTRKNALLELQKTERDLVDILSHYKKTGKIARTDTLRFRTDKDVNAKLLKVREIQKQIKGSRYRFKTRAR